MAAIEEQRAITGGKPAKRVARRVADHVGFGFDDTPAHPALRMLVDQGLADQEPREGRSVGRKLGAAKATRGFVHEAR